MQSSKLEKQRRDYARVDLRDCDYEGLLETDSDRIQV